MVETFADDENEIRNDIAKMRRLMNEPESKGH
jgi:hypothetical protein